ncbi:hypothetical protein HUG10_06425 [Halorarum halophilum]|uniref:Uncharacterized protein n=1 Tax=Halorarum halophilum TaxID=2743090 RepID=A0A7D5KWT6_9EURY|nr:hypothetical protein [Halobaculum halophilum]QLG27198.1 hypothetical protein HUG10_06425 [Halobaculum halophilum]
MHDRTRGLVYIVVAVATLFVLLALTALPSVAPGLPFVGTVGYSFALLALMVVAFPLLWVGGRRTMESLRDEFPEDDAVGRRRRE